MLGVPSRNLGPDNSIVFHDYLNKVLAGNRAFSPSPLMGERWGGGGKILMMTISFSPSPQPPPTRGGGVERALIYENFFRDTTLGVQWKPN